MKIIRFLLVSALFIQSFSLKAQSTAGKEFWLTFGYSEALSALSATDFTIRIVTGNLKTTGYIYFTALGTYEPFSINPFEVYTYHLNDAQKIAAYNTTMGASNKSIYIYSSNPVSVYSGALRGSNGDVTNVLPVTTLNREYYQISYSGWGSGTFSDAYAVVATQNSTQIYHNNLLEATLQTGDVYYRTYVPDMTGDHITSNNPVAFFAVNQNASIPHSTIVFVSQSRLFQQLASVDTWGKTFFVPVTHHAHNVVRIVASQNNTYVTQTGGTIQTGVSGAQTDLTNLQAGEFVELHVNSVDSGCYIIANKPIAVNSYIPSLAASATPAQSWISGIEQTVTLALVAPYQNYFSSTGVPVFASYALIVTPTATRDNTKVSINGAPPTDLIGGSWKGNGDAGMSYYAMPLTDDNASYAFTNPEGMIIMGYGVPVSSSSIIVSYYYLACSAMRDLQAAFYANDIPYQLLKENPICESLVHFRAEVEGLHPTASPRLQWYINGVEETSALNQLTWSKTFAPGEYEIRMWVRFENNDTISKIGMLKICDPSAAFYANNIHYATLNGQTICDANIFNFRAEIEGLHSDAGSLKWFINGAEYLPARDQQQWTYNYFPNDTYTVEMRVRYANDTIETIPSTFIIYVGGHQVEKYKALKSHERRLAVFVLAKPA